MKDSKLFLLAFPFGDYEGVRQRLDSLAKKGWELTGRAGLFWGKFQSTKRQELYYDVIPADSGRDANELMEEVRHREEAGWEPVETVWGMDIYKSLPCQCPKCFREEEDYRHFRKIFQGWLIRSLIFLAVTVLALLVLSHVSGFGWREICDQWYFSDSRTALFLLLPVIAVLAAAWVIWLVWCLLFRGKQHRSCGTVSLYLKTYLQLLAFAALVLLVATLWTEQIPRLWLRLLLTALILLLPILALIPFKEDLKRYTMTVGVGAVSLFAIAMVLGWVISPVSYNSYENGNGWRKNPEGISILTGEALELDTGDGHAAAFYDRDEAILVTQEHYSEHWDNDLSLQLSTYHAHLPVVADLLWEDLVPDGAEQTEDLAAFSSNSWHQVWYRSGNTIYHLSGTLDWSEDELWLQAETLLGSR